MVSGTGRTCKPVHLLSAHLLSEFPGGAFPHLSACGLVGKLKLREERGSLHCIPPLALSPVKEIVFQLFHNQEEHLGGGGV